MRGGFASDGDCHLNGGCQCGAAGTIFYKRCEGGGKTMVVDNKGKSTAASSQILGDTFEYMSAPRLDVLQVQYGAQLATVEGHYGNVSATRLLLKEDARVHLHIGQWIVASELTITSAVVIGADVMGEGRRALLRGNVGTSSGIKVTTFSMDPASKVSGVARWQVGDQALVNGEIEALSGDIEMAVGGKFLLHVFGSISAQGVIINATYLEVEGKLAASRSTPNTCPPYELACGATAAAAGLRDVECNYPLITNVDQLTVRNSGVMAGGAKKICSEAVRIEEGQITASVLGHSAGIGPSEAQKPSGCVTQQSGASLNTGAGSGGAHGGDGGDAGNFKNISGCSGGDHYDNMYSPTSMGSGGGGHKGGRWRRRAPARLRASDGDERPRRGRWRRRRAHRSARDHRRRRGRLGRRLRRFCPAGGGDHHHAGARRDQRQRRQGGIPGRRRRRWRPNSAAVYPRRRHMAGASTVPLLTSITSNGGKGGAAGNDTTDVAGSDGLGTNFTGGNCSAGLTEALCTKCELGHYKNDRGGHPCYPCPIGSPCQSDGLQKLRALRGSGW